MEAAGKFEIGVDIGGTFTDVVCRDDKGAMRLVKIPTTRLNPSAGVEADEYEQGQIGPRARMPDPRGAQ